MHSIDVFAYELIYCHFPKVWPWHISVTMSYGSLESIFDGLGLCNSCTLAIILLLKSLQGWLYRKQFFKKLVFRLSVSYMDIFPLNDCYRVTFLNWRTRHATKVRQETSSSL